MRRRGELIRVGIPTLLRHHSDQFSAALGPYGSSLSIQGKDGAGPKSRIPWIRICSKAMSPSARQGWYLVFLFHPDASGVSLCLSHGSTHLREGSLYSRSRSEAAQVISWASSILGKSPLPPGVRKGIDLGPEKLSRAYEATTLFSKFYPADAIPGEERLVRDVLSFMPQLEALYFAQETLGEPGTRSVEVASLESEIQRIAAPLRPAGFGQGRGLPAEARRLVELRAMDVAATWLTSNDFEFEDVSRSDSCDFRATKLGKAWVVEVKGTTGAAGSILLTKNEVKLHRDSYPQNVLLVVHGISLSPDRKLASGGELLVLDPWTIADEQLTPVCYEYRIS